MVYTIILLIKFHIKRIQKYALLQSNTKEKEMLIKTVNVQ